MLEMLRGTMFITHIWILVIIHLPLSYGNIFDILEEPKRTMYEKHVNQVLQYFDKTKGLYVFYKQDKFLKHEIDKVIKSLDEEATVFEMTQVITIINNTVDYYDDSYQIIYIGLILGQWNWRYLDEFVKIKVCIILMNSQDELKDFLTEYSEVCVRLFFLTPQGELLTKEYSKIKEIKNGNYFNQKLNLHKNKIGYLDNKLLGQTLNCKDEIFIKLIERKLNATIRVSMYGELTLLNVIMTYRRPLISYPYKIQRYCFVVRKSNPLSVIQSLMQSTTVWVLLISTIIICSGICGRNPLSLLINFFQKQIFKNDRILPSRDILDTNNLMRISLASLLLSSIVIITTFQAIYFAVIHSPMRAPQINSINMLNDLNYTIYCFYNTDCSRFHVFEKKLNFNQNSDGNFSLFYKNRDSKVALLMSCEQAQKQIMNHPFHSQFLYIMDQEHGSYPIHLEYKWNIHFEFEIISLLRSLYENGIFQQVEKLEHWKGNFREIINLKSKPPPIMLTTNEIQGALFILFFGCSISLVVLIVELLINKLKFRNSLI